MTLIFGRLLKVVKLHVHAIFHQGKCSGSRAIVLTKEIGDDAANNTAVASAGSNKAPGNDVF